MWPEKLVTAGHSWSQLATEVKIWHFLNTLKVHEGNVLTLYGLISLIGIFIGFEIPLISRLNEEHTENIEANLASILKMDYIGALVGALIWVFVLPKFFTLNQVAFILGGFSLLTALICLLFFRTKMKSFRSMSCALFIAFLLLCIGFKQSNKWALYSEQALYFDKVIYSDTSPYQHIVLTESDSGTLRCYINGHIQFASDDEHIYHELLVHPAMSLAGRKERILVLGGGDGMAVREVLKHPEVKEITLVDLDPFMTKLASEHPVLSQLNEFSLTDKRVQLQPSDAISQGEKIPLEFIPQRRLRRQTESSVGPLLHLQNIDAANFIQNTHGLYDVIILDFPDPSNVEVAKLYSQHFYIGLKKILSADGIIIQQSTSTYRAKEAFLCIGRTLNSSGLSAIPFHDHVPSFGEWGWWIASHAELSTTSELTERMSTLSDLPQELNYLTAELIHSSLHFGQNDLETTERDITTILNPAVLNHYHSGWTH